MSSPADGCGQQRAACSCLLPSPSEATPHPPSLPVFRCATSQFGNIQLSGKDQQRDENSGTLKVHAGGFGWKSRKTGNIISVQKADLRGVEWLKIPHAYQLKLRVKGGFVYKFNGFRSQVYRAQETCSAPTAGEVCQQICALVQDKDTIKMYCKDTFEADMEDVHMSYKGWNWGEGSIEGMVIPLELQSLPHADACSKRNLSAGTAICHSCRHRISQAGVLPDIFAAPRATALSTGPFP
jgi:hypothetical protein